MECNQRPDFFIFYFHLCLILIPLSISLSSFHLFLPLYLPMSHAHTHNDYNRPGSSTRCPFPERGVVPVQNRNQGALSTLWSRGIIRRLGWGGRVKCCSSEARARTYRAVLRAQWICFAKRIHSRQTSGGRQGVGNFGR